MSTSTLFNWDWKVGSDRTNGTKDPAKQVGRQMPKKKGVTVKWVDAPKDI